MVSVRGLIRSLAGGAILFVVGASLVAAPVSADSLAQTSTSEAQGVSIVSNQSNLALTSSSPGAVATTSTISDLSAAAGPPAGWFYNSTHPSYASCKGRGQELVDLRIAATFGCFLKNGKYELWYSRACYDRVATRAEDTEL